MNEEAQEIEATEVDETPVQDVENTETQDSAQSAIEGETDTPDGEDSTAKPKPKGVQKRIDELTSNWRNTERDRDYWRDLALRNQNSQQPQQAQTAPTQPQGEPQVDQFDDYDDYTRALARYEAKQLFEAQQREAKEREEQIRQQQAIQSFSQREETFRAEHPDYESVVRDPYLPVTEHMADAIRASDSGPQVLYHLGVNKDEATRIAQLPPVQQIRELTLLEARLTAKPQPKPSSAPDPVKPVGGNQPPVVDPSKMTTDEWMKWRNKQLQN